MHLRSRLVGLVMQSACAAAMLLPAPACAQLLLPQPGQVFNTGQIYAEAVQPDGGVVIGGYFQYVDGVPRNNIARFHADGSLDLNWNPDADDVVTALAVGSNGTVYAGGNFLNIGGHARDGLAALDGTAGSTGSALNWNGAGGGAIAVAPGGGPVWGVVGAGGNEVAAYDATGNVIASFFTDGAVYALALDATGSTLYVGGAFTQMNGQPRANLGAWNTTSNALLPWNPGANNYVWTLTVGNGHVYAGGDFDQIAGQARARMAELDAVTGAPLPWTPSADYSVYALAVNGSTVYAGGCFGSINGQPAYVLAAIDATTGSLNAWSPGVDDCVGALAVSGTSVYAGGYSVISWVNSASTVTGGLARIDATSAAIAATPQITLDSSVNAVLVQSDGKVLVGGAFTAADNMNMPGVARFNTDGTIDPTFYMPLWLDSAYYPYVEVDALAQSGGTYYVGFTGGTPARPDVDSHFWTRDTVAHHTYRDTVQRSASTARIHSITLAGSSVFIGGSFDTIRYQSSVISSYPNIAALNPANGTTATSWNPGINGVGNVVHKLAASGSTLYVGGENFAQCGGLPRTNLCAFDANTGAVLAWNPSPDGNVYALAASGNAVYAGGDFANIGGSPRARLAALDPLNNGQATSWNPGADATVDAITLSGSNVLVGGNFWYLNGELLPYLSGLDALTGETTWANADQWNPYVDNPVYAVASGNDAVYVGGIFKDAGGVTRLNIAAFTPPDVIYHGGFEALP